MSTNITQNIILPQFNIPTKKLELNATLNDLPATDVSIDIKEPGSTVFSILIKDPHIPGVILKSDTIFEGMISRHLFFEFLSKPYGRDLFLNRSICDVYEEIKPNILVMSDETSIIAAMVKVLSRKPELVYEPFVVENDSFVYKIMDVYHLLLAHSHIHKLAKDTLDRLNAELKVKNIQLEQLATIDGLTKVSNRRKFDEIMNAEWTRLSREKKPLSLMMCDVDHFKKYNDTYGHQMGDNCLIKVAEALKKSIHRPADTIARYGGEEFAIILPKTDTDGAEHIAKDIIENVNQCNIPHNRSQHKKVSISIGVASVIPNSSDSYTSLIKKADEALYHAKENGRNRHAIYLSKEH